MKSSHLKLVERTDMRPVASKGRKPNEAYRVREHLTEDEMSKLLAALKANRHGQRDWLIGLLIYRHGLRVSEACDLRWDDIGLAKRTIRSAASRAAMTVPTILSAMSSLASNGCSVSKRPSQPLCSSMSEGSHSDAWALAA